MSIYFLSGCYFRAHINDFNDHDSARNNDSTSPSDGTSTPAAPTGLLVTLSAPSFTKIDSNSDFTITLSEVQLADVTINYETQDSTALSPVHYVATKGSVVILAGNTTATFSVNTTNKSDSAGTFKNFITRLTSTSLGTIASGDQITAVGMHQLNGIITLIGSTAEDFCGLDSAGYAWCWGPSSPSKSAQKPEPLNYLTSKISIGMNHNCALTLSGGVKCWGSNYSGSLGDGTSNVSLTTAVDVVGLSSGVIDIKSGFNHTCILTAGGGIKCWGQNSNGQLGNNSTINSNIPVDVSGLTSGVSKIFVGGNFSCALLTSTSGVKCWGQNSNGQLGDGTTTDRSSPVDVSGLTSGVIDMAQGMASNCAITNMNALKCWGQNNYGQLGDGTTTNRSVPTDVTGLAANVTKITTFSSHSCALLSTGSVKCWGQNLFGELGDGTFVQSLTPVTASNLGASSQIIDIQLSLNSTCILKTDNKVYCIGNNTYGSTGDGNITASIKIPQRVFNSGSSIQNATKGENHTCYINSSNGVECWGHNFYGQLGNSSSSDKAIPTAVTGLSSGVVSISAGRYHTCALLNTNTVKCWGLNSSGQLGDNTAATRYSPVTVSGLVNVTAISAGQYHTCALINDGTVKCWGYNSHGQLGDNTTVNKYIPASVASLGLTVTSIAAGFLHTCAIMSDTTLKCWGNNDNGELGNGTTTRSTTPVLVSGLSGVTKVSAAQFSTCAIVSQAVKCWGSNFSGELGDMTWTQSSIPVDVIGAESNIVDIMASGYDYTDYVCALTNTGGLKCWGNNSGYQCGNEDFDIYGNDYARDVIGLKSGVAKLVQGKGIQTCIIGTDGYLKCFGFNDTYNKAGGVIYTTLQSVLVAHEDL